MTHGVKIQGWKSRGAVTANNLLRCHFKIVGAPTFHQPSVFVHILSADLLTWLLWHDWFLLLPRWTEGVQCAHVKYSFYPSTNLLWCVHLLKLCHLLIKDWTTIIPGQNVKLIPSQCERANLKSSHITPGHHHKERRKSYFSLYFYFCWVAIWDTSQETFFFRFLTWID